MPASIGRGRTLMTRWIRRELRFLFNFESHSCCGKTVRRDNCCLVQTVIDTCLRLILIDKNIVAAIDYAKSTISDLLQNKIDLSQLVISKQLSKSGEEYAGKQAHVELAARMRKRDAGLCASKRNDDC